MFFFYTFIHYLLGDCVIKLNNFEFSMNVRSYIKEQSKKLDIDVQVWCIGQTEWAAPSDCLLSVPLLSAVCCLLFAGCLSVFAFVICGLSATVQ